MCPIMQSHNCKYLLRVEIQYFATTCTYARRANKKNNNKRVMNVTDLLAFSIIPLPVAKNLTNEFGIDESTALISKISPSCVICAPRCCGPPLFAVYCTNRIFLPAVTLNSLLLPIISFNTFLLSNNNRLLLNDSNVCNLMVLMVMQNTAVVFVNKKN